MSRALFLSPARVGDLLGVDVRDDTGRVSHLVRQCVGWTEHGVLPAAAPGATIHATQPDFDRAVVGPIEKLLPEVLPASWLDAAYGQTALTLSAEGCEQPVVREHLVTAAIRLGRRTADTLERLLELSALLEGAVSRDG
jgi:hypothetical protein